MVDDLSRTPGAYLKRVLEDGGRPYRYRSRLRGLLGWPESEGVKVRFARPLPWQRFPYARPQFIGELNVADEWQSRSSNTITYIENDFQNLPAARPERFWEPVEDESYPAALSPARPRPAAQITAQPEAEQDEAKPAMARSPAAAPSGIQARGTPLAQPSTPTLSEPPVAPRQAPIPGEPQRQDAAQTAAQNAAQNAAPAPGTAMGDVTTLYIPGAMKGPAPAGKTDNQHTPAGRQALPAAEEIHPAPGAVENPAPAMQPPTMEAPSPTGRPAQAARPELRRAQPAHKAVQRAPSASVPEQAGADSPPESQAWNVPAKPWHEPDPVLSSAPRPAVKAPPPPRPVEAPAETAAAKPPAAPVPAVTYTPAARQIVRPGGRPAYWERRHLIRRRPRLLR